MMKKEKRVRNRNKDDGGDFEFDDDSSGKGGDITRQTASNGLEKMWRSCLCMH